MSRDVNRRQFVTKSAKSIAAGAAAVAGASAVAKTVQACPYVIGPDGKQVEYWCPITFDDSNPIMWEYTWKHCPTGDLSYVWGSPNEPLGSCTFADQDVACLTYDPTLIDVTTIRVAGKDIYVSKKATQEQITQLQSFLLARQKG